MANRFLGTSWFLKPLKLFQSFVFLNQKHGDGYDTNAMKNYIH